MKLVDDCFKQADGTWDLSRLMWAGLIVAFVCNAAWAVLQSHGFDAQNFGIGAGALLGAGGAGVWAHGKAP